MGSRTLKAEAMSWTAGVVMHEGFSTREIWHFECLHCHHVWEVEYSVRHLTDGHGNEVDVWLLGDLPAMPPPSGSVSESPCFTRILSIGMPSSDATICETVVSCPCPCDCVPIVTTTLGLRPPPSSSWLTSSPVTVLITSGPVMNICPEFCTCKMTSVSAGAAPR